MGLCWSREGLLAPDGADGVLEVPWYVKAVRHGCPSDEDVKPRPGHSVRARRARRGMSLLMPVLLAQGSDLALGPGTLISSTWPTGQPCWSSQRIRS